jgi:hypothetical protein
MRRHVLSTSDFSEKAESLLFTKARGKEALRGLIEVVRRSPDEQGMAVRGRPGYRSRPVHLEARSYLVLYTFDDDSVTLVDLREVPKSVY